MIFNYYVAKHRYFSLVLISIFSLTSVIGINFVKPGRYFLASLTLAAAITFVLMAMSIVEVLVKESQQAAVTNLSNLVGLKLYRAALSLQPGQTIPIETGQLPKEAVKEIIENFRNDSNVGGFIFSTFAGNNQIFLSRSG